MLAPAGAQLCARAPGCAPGSSSPCPSCRAKGRSHSWRSAQGAPGMNLAQGGNLRQKGPFWVAGSFALTNICSFVHLSLFPRSRQVFCWSPGWRAPLTLPVPAQGGSKHAGAGALLSPLALQPQLRAPQSHRQTGALGFSGTKDQ